MNLQGRDLTQDLNGEDVKLLQNELAQIGFPVPDAERQRAVFGPGTRDAVMRFQKGHRLAVTGTVGAETAREINREVDAGTFVVSGTVSSPDRAGIGGLTVQIVDKNVGDDVALATTSTDDRGEYQVHFVAGASLRERRKARPDLQARVLAGGNAVGASEIHYNAANVAALNVVLSANLGSLPAEHETLTAAIGAHYAGRLGELKESGDRHDVTYLANKTGWDARAVALAALADRFSENAAPGAAAIPAPFYYALFRAGLPASPDVLYGADAAMVAGIWKKALEKGVIPAALGAEIQNATDAFQKLSAVRALDARAVAGTSTLKEMLAVTLGNDPRRQQQVAELLVRYRSDLPKFWESVRGVVGDATTRQLQLDGQLAYLTLNNATLVGRVRDGGGQPLSSTSELAARGFYRAAKWNDLLDGSIPDHIPGATPADRRANYAELLAAQVRLSFPTAVVADMVRTGELPVAASDEVRKGVQTFLTAHQGKFEIGMQPIEQYLNRNAGETVPAAVTQQIKRLQRVYQITPDDQTMKALLENKLDSAYRITRHDRDEFVKRYKDDLGGEAKARFIYAKSQQVHNVVLNIASSYLAARLAPTLGADQAGRVVNAQPRTIVTPEIMRAVALSGERPSAVGRGDHLTEGLAVREVGVTGRDVVVPASDVIAYPTLEGLFGSMDYCTCGQCRSILSPAAYLVDLLHFVDRPVNDKENPQAVLLERRPDLQHLPLTCENTNTPMPYIDVVNEALEYFVVHNLSLANYAGHNTGDLARPEELLATPQYVDDAAYAALKAEFFPPPLPFHKPLETLRRHSAKLDVPLQDLMERLRTDDAVERANAGVYGWRDILMEELEFSRNEYRLLTDRSITLQQLYGFTPQTAEATVLTTLANVQTFTRRLGVTYEQLADLLKTKFINPNGTLIPRLLRLAVPFSTLKALKDGTIADQDFDALLPAGLDPWQYGGDIKGWVKNNANYARIMGLITIVNPDGGTSVDQLELRYANPDNNANALQAIDYVRLARFIRLWKKLGWSIEATDQAIAALYPPAERPTGANVAADLQHLDNGFLALLPRLGIAAQVLRRLELTPEKHLPGLLACWAPLDVYGATALYRSMFLTPAVLEHDPAFADDGYGNVLTSNVEKLLPHVETLRAAFNLTGDEFSLIAASLNVDANTPLTLANITAIFRRGWLARRLRVSVRELLLLIQFTGLDPFASPDPPTPPVTRLVQLVDALRAASLKPVQALYLIWNQDISGKSAPASDQVTEFARALRADFAAVESEFAIADDPTGEIASARMALVYSAAATDFFFGLLNNTLSVDVPYAHGQVTLEAAINAAAPGRVGYDDFRKRLSYSGVLTTAARDALKNAAGVTQAFKAAVDALYASNQAAIGPFFAQYPELLPLFTAYDASADPPETKRSALLANFLPELKRRRKRRTAIAAVTAAARTEDVFAEAILADPAVLHAVADNASPALDDLAAVETPGLSAQFYWRTTATGAVDSTIVAAGPLSYAPATNPLPANPTAGNPISGTWSGYLEAPANGFYNVAIVSDGGATVTLVLDAVAIPLGKNGNEWRNQNPIEFRAGSVHAIVLTVEAVKDTLAVRWQTTGSGLDVVPRRYLYSNILVDRLRTTFTRFLKIATVASALKLTAAETAFLGAHADYFVGGEAWPNVLPVSGKPSNPLSIALRGVLEALIEFARIKRAASAADERLLAVLKDPAATLPNGDRQLLALTGWNADTPAVLLARFNKMNADLAHVDVFGRVYDAAAVVSASGVSAAGLIAAATNEPDATTIRDLQAALRARFDEADWLALLRPINDELRALSRDALVASVLRSMSDNAATSHIDTADKLFEFFLMDVQIEPCMQTSRIRHALSSVQLFIERCLMNLEPRVAPSSILAKQWEWMKRYRVWEANRKVFLWPENWLEPELRDDQSPIFKETIGELLQSDITEDTAAGALLNYLSKLDEVARLEPCGIFYAENDPGYDDDVAHVVARTAGAHRKYYYRRREYGYWTPWEPIPLDIEDNPVMPVVWKHRLFLFWLRLLQETPIDPTDQPTSTSSTKLSDLSVSAMKQDAGSVAQTKAKVRINAVLCWSEYYNSKWQPARTSDVTRPAYLGSYKPVGADAFNRSELTLGVSVIGDALNLTIGGSGSSRFVLYSTHSAPIRYEDVKEWPTGYTGSNRPRDFTTSTETFTVWYAKPGEDALQRNVLKQKIAHRVIDPKHPLENIWDAPFLFEDSRHVFYVTSSERMVKVPDYGDYGVVVQPWITEVVEIPNLVLERPPKPDDPRAELAGITSHGVGVTDPSPMQRFVTEDINIRHGIGTNATVQYDSQQIGPGGAIEANVSAQR